ncbi:MAG: rod shape-determining protein [candidate division Zixibacteria bacterium]|nr:rod shape-determining protein [candidate division Zixibacteria bacterium]
MISAPPKKQSRSEGSNLGFFDSLSNDIGIDLGTANTLVYVRNQGIVLNEPSVVAIEKSTGKILAVGSAAKEMTGRTPSGIEAIRPLKDGVIADFDMSEKLIANFIRRVVKHKYLMKPRVVISVPSGITEVEKRAVRDSAEGAGAREVYLIQEPMAAAIGVGLNVDQPTGIMIIDIGGGTSEIAVIALNGIVNDTSIRVAGDEFNDSIINYLKKNYNLLIGELTAEDIKIKIGSAFPLEKELTMEVKGRDLVAGVPKNLKVSSVQIREALSETLDIVVEAVRQALEQTPPELASDILERGIILTGGGALLRGLDKLLRQETNLPVNVADDPLTCVVRGTGKVLENFQKYTKVLERSRKD